MTRDCADCGKTEPAPLNQTNKPKGPWRCKNCVQKAYRKNGTSPNGKPGWGGANGSRCSPELARRIIDLLTGDTDAIQRWRAI